MFARIGVMQARVNQLLTAPMYSAVGHSGRVCAGLRPALKRACAPMALDPEEIVTLLLLAGNRLELEARALILLPHWGLRKLAPDL